MQFKRDEALSNNADLSIDNSKLFKYKAALVGKTANAVNNTKSSEIIKATTGDTTGDH